MIQTRRQTSGVAHSGQSLIEYALPGVIFVVSVALVATILNIDNITGTFIARANGDRPASGSYLVSKMANGGNAAYQVGTGVGTVPNANGNAAFGNGNAFDSSFYAAGAAFGANTSNATADATGTNGSVQAVLAQIKSATSLQQASSIIQNSGLPQGTKDIVAELARSEYEIGGVINTNQGGVNNGYIAGNMDHVNRSMTTMATLALQTNSPEMAQLTQIVNQMALNAIQAGKNSLTAGASSIDAATAFHSGDGSLAALAQALATKAGMTVPQLLQSIGSNATDIAQLQAIASQQQAIASVPVNSAPAPSYSSGCWASDGCASGDSAIFAPLVAASNAATAAAAAIASAQAAVAADQTALATLQAAAVQDPVAIAAAQAKLAADQAALTAATTGTSSTTTGTTAP